MPRYKSIDFIITLAISLYWGDCHHFIFPPKNTVEARWG